MKAKRGFWLFIAAALGVSIGLAALIAPFASSAPDGLERAAEDHGIAAQPTSAAPVADLAPMPDYAVPGVRNERLSTAIAGVIGTLLAFGLALALAALIRRRSSRQSVN